MISIFVLEDDFLQQGRLETTIAAIMKEKNWSYKELTIFGKPQLRLDSIILVQLLSLSRHILSLCPSLFSIRYLLWILLINL